jgi:hypothetical protein
MLIHLSQTLSLYIVTIFNPFQYSILSGPALPTQLPCLSYDLRRAEARFTKQKKEGDGDCDREYTPPTACQKSVLHALEFGNMHPVVTSSPPVTPAYAGRNGN